MGKKGRNDTHAKKIKTTSRHYSQCYFLFFKKIIDEFLKITFSQAPTQCYITGVTCLHL